MQRILTVLSLAFGAALLGSYGGALHPLGDSLAVFRVPLAVFFALPVIWSDWPRILRWTLTGLAFLAMAQIVAPRLETEDPVVADLRLYQQNLLFNRQSDADWLRAVRDSGADMLTLQEVSRRNRALLQALQSDYPTQLFCPFAGVGGVAVATRFPAVPGTEICAEGDGLAALQVQTGQGAVWLVSVHLNWPWPFGQADQIDRLLPLIEQLDGPVILAGDFNAVGWSHSVARVARASGTQRAGPQGATFDLPHIAMPVTIDHVLADPGFAVSTQVMPKLGSDHHGVLARIAAF
ncbi:endonuclease/exonuclease/phosphatase family protein [Aestuariicoccus sp. MJ-SS9]|uniref:endonuclease/exonuclease/phosphatase family protein n=1 Tax=Aestuariicoccus sp. MJ-SS9 TaxID=3079855 RepID=UPI002912CBCF|nr:endonuclease/exonuclease/phosphatase family protein [Aestuariicoccus sp. MJ-SS9]MDU8913619.1 endonuclease/exonuclease/phosphatase family protein [Aestuariicoccus sp. MJ-SS9]